MTDDLKIIGNSSHPEEIEEAAKHLAKLCKKHNLTNVILVSPMGDNWNNAGIVSIHGSGKGMDFCMLALQERLTAHDIRSQMMEGN